MIIVTGAAGFIGSCLVSKLNNKGIKDIILVDDFSNPEKNRNTGNKSFVEKIDRRLFSNWLTANYKMVDFIFHIGARTDTTEFNMSVFDELNLNYSKTVWKACTEFSIPLIYASSAATYGDGSLGYVDDHALIPSLKPLNPYGISKNEFDKWVLDQTASPPYWYGLKFFNVYGPNEYHKNRMASVVMHAYNTIQKTGHMELFKSHHADYRDGEQSRDFVFVDDIADVMLYFMENQKNPGIYNVGTGKARSFQDLTLAVFQSTKIKPEISFIDTPVDLRGQYQYFTEADITKLRKAGYTRPFTSLEDGVDTYVGKYLAHEACY